MTKSLSELGIVTAPFLVIFLYMSITEVIWPIDKGRSAGEWVAGDPIVDPSTAVATTTPPADLLPPVTKAVETLRVDLGEQYSGEFYISTSARQCCDPSSSFLSTARSSAATHATEAFMAAQRPGYSPALLASEELKFLMQKGFLCARATVRTKELPSVVVAGDRPRVRVGFTIDGFTISESAPRDGEVTRACKLHFQNHVPINYEATLDVAQDNGSIVIVSHGQSGKPLIGNIVRRIVQDNVSVLLSLELPEAAKKAALDVIKR